MVPVDAHMQPLNEYYLWCDHRAKEEAQQITALAHRENLEAIEWCGGVYSHEWGFAKLLHWLRHNPEKRGQFASAFEHCDMVAATLCGITDPAQAKRSVCAMGHKWMWNPKWDGLPPQEFLSKLDPLLRWRSRQTGRRLPDLGSSGRPPRLRTGQTELGLRAGIPMPVGAFDAHWDALGAGCREGRRRQRGRHLDLHHRHGQEDGARPRRVRRRSGQRAPAVHRHRGGLVGHRRHLRSHRPPRRA